MSDELQNVSITKIVHGGQGLGELPDGRKVFVWNSLPGETVLVRVIKQKKSYAEAIAEEVVTASTERIAPSEDNYLATSPWQMMTFEAENKYKKGIVQELFAHEHVSLPKISEVIHDERQWHYRNKMEYSFWGDDDGLHLALHQRGSHGKQIVVGSKLALERIDQVANALVAELSKLQPRAGDLKTIIVRASQSGEVVAALYTKLEKFSQLELPPQLKGLRVYHSNPQSPASVPTKLIYEIGDCQLSDILLGTKLEYDVESFFQANVPIFEQTLQQIKGYITEPDIVDMYAGVGAIGLSVAPQRVRLIELDQPTAAMATANAAASTLDAEAVQASTEKSLDYITGAQPVIFDPPRAGLYHKVVEKVLAILPPKIVYLSCNPATHARDLKLLEEAYSVTDFQVYNFFPRTPHIETLALLIRK